MEFTLKKPDGEKKQEEKQKKGYKTVEPVLLDALPKNVKFLCSKDICRVLNISNSTLKNLRANKAIPYYKIGGTFRYNRDEIIDFLKENYSKQIW